MRVFDRRDLLARRGGRRQRTLPSLGDFGLALRRARVLRVRELELPLLQRELLVPFELQPKGMGAVWEPDARRFGSFERRSGFPLCGVRLREPFVRDARGVLETAGYQAAVEAAAARLRRVLDASGPGAVAALASPHASNEDLLALRRFLDALGVESCGAPLVTGTADGLLIKAEKAANAFGARALGFEAAEGVIERIRSGSVEALLVMGHELLHESLLGSAEPLASLDSVIVLDTEQSPLRHVAHVMLPVRHAAEKFGTFTSHGGRVQSVRPAVEPAWEAYSDGEVLARLGAALGLDGFDGRYDVRAVSRALGGANAAFAGIHLDSVGDQGRFLPGSAPSTEATRS